MKTTKTVLMLLAAGSLGFTACQSNNRPVAIKTDTTTTPVVEDHMANNLGQANVPPATTETTTTPATASSNSVLIDTTEMVCVPRRRVPPAVAQKVAYRGVRSYNRWRSRKHENTTVATVEETTVVAEEPVAVAPEAAPVTPAPVEQAPVITYKKENEFTGNVMPSPPRRSKVHLGFEAGGNLNNLYMNSDGVQRSNQLKAGYHGGVVMDVELGQRLDYQTGLRYIMKGGEMTSTSVNGLVTTEHKEKMAFHYIEMPMNFVYNAGDRGTSHFMIGAGPYVAAMVSAQDKTKDVVTGPDGVIENIGQHKMEIGHADTKPGNLRAIDAGAGGFIGYQMKSGVYVKGGAEIGVVSLQKNSNTLGDFYNRNYNFLFSLGYLCGYKK